MPASRYELVLPATLLGIMDPLGLFDSFFDVVNRVVGVPAPGYAAVLPSTSLATEGAGESLDLSDSSFESVNGVVGLPALGFAAVLPSNLLATGGVSR